MALKTTEFPTALRTPWDSHEGRRNLADYLAEVNNGASVRGSPSIIGRIRRLFQTASRSLPDSRRLTSNEPIT